MSTIELDNMPLDINEGEDMFEDGNENEEEDINFEDLRQDLQRFQKEDIVRDALEKEVDLKAYGLRIDEELNDVSYQSVEDYLQESVHLAHLHSEIKVSDNILAQMQELLHKFQKDLSEVSSEIRVLQNESLTISVKLKNRKEADVLLRDFINKIALTPSMVKILSDGAINKQYIDNLTEFVKQLDYIYSPNVDPAVGLSPAEIRSIQESREDIDILKTQTGVRIKNHIYQKEVLLQNNVLYQYLVKYVPKTAEDIKTKYVSIMKDICISIFKEYKEGLFKYYQEIGNADDILIHTDNAVMSFLKKTSQQNKKTYTWTTYELNNRHVLIANIYTQPLLLHLLESEKPSLTFPDIYRSLLKQLIDMSVSEYQFSLQFFDINNNSIYNDIYTNINKIVIDMCSDYLKNCYDIVGVILCYLLTNIYKMKLEEENVFILSDLLNLLKTKFQDKYTELMDKNIKSAHEAQSRVKNIVIEDNIHYFIKRYANLATSIQVMNASYSQFLDHDAFINKLNLLTAECLELLTKISNKLDSNKKQCFVIANCVYIMDIFNNYHIPQDSEVQRIFDDHSHLYIQEKLEKYFKFLVTFVSANKENVGGNLKLSSKDNTNIKKYSGEWKKSIESIYKNVWEDFDKQGLAIFKQVINEVTNYNAKYSQILQGTSAAKDVIPLQTIINEITKYRANYE
ncbi:hypothetical protein WA158_004144 [Blastocystis sp. Blastoise]